MQNCRVASSTRKGKSLSMYCNKPVKYFIQYFMRGNRGGREGEDAAGVAGAAGLFLFPLFPRLLPTLPGYGQRMLHRRFHPQSPGRKGISWSTSWRSTELCGLYWLPLAPRNSLDVQSPGRGMQQDWDQGQDKDQDKGQGEGPWEIAGRGGIGQPSCPPGQHQQEKPPLWIISPPDSHIDEPGLQKNCWWTTVEGLLGLGFFFTALGPSTGGKKHPFWRLQAFSKRPHLLGGAMCLWAALQEPFVVVNNHRINWNL